MKDPVCIQFPQSLHITTQLWVWPRTMVLLLYIWVVFLVYLRVMVLLWLRVILLTLRLIFLHGWEEPLHLFLHLFGSQTVLLLPGLFGCWLRLCKLKI